MSTTVHAKVVLPTSWIFSIINNIITFSCQ